jgi:hypothetical protein
MGAAAMGRLGMSPRTAGGDQDLLRHVVGLIECGEIGDAFENQGLDGRYQGADGQLSQQPAQTGRS